MAQVWSSAAAQCSRGSLALLLAALVVVPLGAMPASAGAAQVEPGRLFRVLAPKDDALQRGERLRVRLLLRPGVSLRSARLNGRSVRRSFRRARGGRLVATLQRRRLGGRLVRGRNFLRFVVRRRGRRDYETVVFTRVRRDASIVSRFGLAVSRAGGARVTLAPSDQRAHIRVWLNGHDVSREFLDGAPLLRRVALGASDGLRHGLNRLRVRVHAHHGSYVVFTRTFRVRSGTTIAGAGPDLHVRARGQARLDGSRSLPARTRHGSRRGRLRYRWRIVRRPRHSHARLRHPHAKRPTLRPDRPGTYRVRLTTTQRVGGRTIGAWSDSADVQATAQPQVPVSTFATVGGKHGIFVGVTRDCTGSGAASPGCFFPNPGADSDLQVVVLDRTTLDLVSNTSYPTSDLSGFLKLMTSFGVTQASGTCRIAWDTDKLVLIALRSGTITDTNDFYGGVDALSVDPHDCVQTDSGTNPDPAGPFSMIGVPGTLVGKAAVNDGQRIPGPEGTLGAVGSLDGYLQETFDDPAAGEIARRTFSLPGTIAFDTRAGSDGTTVQVGDATDSTQTSGLLLLSFDEIDPESGLRVDANLTPGVAGAGLDWSTLASALADLVKQRRGVVLVSRGQIGGFASEPSASAFPQVLAQIEALGANPDTFARAVAENGTYSLLASRGIAADSSSVMADGVPDIPGQKAADLPVNAGRLVGALRRGPDGRVFPATADPSGLQQPSGLGALLDGAQVPWLLTPAVGSSSATCQQTALAYVAGEAFDGLLPDGLPALWSGASARACQGVDHTGTAGPTRADTLDGDSCATNDPAATGAIGSNVREVSMALRTLYLSVSTTLDSAKVQEVSLPQGAPFTQADLTCAKNQLTDELAAREQVITFMGYLAKPQEDLSGQTVVQFGQVAEAIKTGALASVASQLEAQAAATPSFWSAFVNVASSTADVSSLFAGGAGKALRFLSAALEAGARGADVPAAGGGNPQALADDYLLLSSQLDQEAVDIEAQIEDVLTAQLDGVGRAQAIVLADPHRMAQVDVNANGAWTVTEGALEQAQAALTTKVNQLAYQSFVPQLFTAVRFNYLNSCQNFACWNGGKWEQTSGRGGPATSLTQASGPACRDSSNDAAEDPIGNMVFPFPGLQPGSGRGDTVEYHPLHGVAPKGQTAKYTVELLTQTPSLGHLGNHAPSLAEGSIVSQLFAQPVTPTGATVPTAGAFYPPDFWYRNEPTALRLECNEYSGAVRTIAMHTSPLSAGPWADVQTSNELWPTPDDM